MAQPPAFVLALSLSPCDTADGEEVTPITGGRGDNRMDDASAIAYTMVRLIREALATPSGNAASLIVREPFDGRIVLRA